jgi:hypothetical protein
LRRRPDAWPVNLGCLGTGQFSAKTKDFRYWILLDFLGFSRLERDFSMGYTAFSGKDFSKALLYGVGAPERRITILACGRAGLFIGLA